MYTLPTSSFLEITQGIISLKILRLVSPCNLTLTQLHLLANKDSDDMGFLQCYQLVSNVYTTPSSTQNGRVARFNKENYSQISISDNFFFVTVSISLTILT